MKIVPVLIKMLKFIVKEIFSMSKKFVRSIAAAAAALLMATQAMAFSAFAVAEHEHYHYANGVYYSSPFDAENAKRNPSRNYTTYAASQIPSNAIEKYYDAVEQRWYSTKEEALLHTKYPTQIYVLPSVTENTTYYSPYYDYYYNGYTGYLYYSSYTNQVYSSRQEAIDKSLGNSNYVTRIDGSWYGWDKYSPYYHYGYGYYYSSYTHKYYSTYSAALNASNGNTSYVTAVGYLYNPSTVSSVGSIYKYYYNGVSYPSLQAAKDAGGTVGVDIYYTPYGNTERVGYYYYYNGTYYGTIEAAKKAGGTDLGVDITYVPYGYYGNTNNGGYGYYYNGTYYNYGYYDPYYAVRNDIFGNNKDKITSTKQAEDGEPYIYGKKNRAGWKTVIKYIKNASRGAEIKVDMNGSYGIPKDVLEALDGKNIDLTCVLDNGVKWTINGRDIGSAKDITIYTEYNIDYIPDSLVKKAAKGAVGKAEIGVSNNYDSFGTDASITVKFSGKRAGCTAVVYRYNNDANSLKGVAKAKVQSDGSCTFTATAGGPYLIVLK